MACSIVAAGSVIVAPGSMVTCQTATPESGRAAQECGGGVRAGVPPYAPATTFTRVVRPASSVSSTTGVSSFQKIEKWASAFLSSGARLIQIWNRCSGLGASSRTRGNISAWATPLPAVSHWVSPAP